MRAYRFGEFELDLEARQLRRDGEPVHLERRPFDFLALLVREPGRLHTRDEIIAALWPPRIVIDFDAGLNTVVRKVRLALGDSPDSHRYIDTVPGKGYRFVAPVRTDTPRGLTGDAVTAAAQVPAPSSRRALAAAVLLALAFAAALALWRVVEPEPSKRIAVLPFENLTGDAELDYLATGLAQETSQSLARIDLPDLTVIGAVSARAMASSSMPLSEMAKQAGVDYVVDSSLRIDGTRMRVTSTLVRTRDGEQLWSAPFDRERTNELSLQRDLSIAIAEQIRQKLSPDVAAAIDRRQTQNPTAYRLYLKGREQWTRFHPNSLSDALAYYDQAVLEDPEYGLAWAGIGHSATTATLTSDVSPDVARPRARFAVEQAMRYGPDLAETWVAKGAYHFFVDWDYPGAETAVRRAIELDENNAMAHMTLALALSAQDRQVEARAAMQRARELDPFFPLMFANSCYIERMAGNPELSIEYATQAIAMNADFWPSYYQLGNTLMTVGDYAGALRAFESADKLSDRKSSLVSERAYVLACLGRDEEARELRDMLIARSAERYVPPFSIAYIEAGLGNRASAVEWLQRAIESRDILLTSTFERDTNESLLDHPRFPWLRERCGPVTAGAD